MRVTICKTSNATAVAPVCDITANWQQGWLVFSDGGTKGMIDSGDTLLRVQVSLSAAAAITTRSGRSQGPMDWPMAPSAFVWQATNTTSSTTPGA